MHSKSTSKIPQNTTERCSTNRWNRFISKLSVMYPPSSITFVPQKYHSRRVQFVKNKCALLEDRDSIAWHWARMKGITMGMSFKYSTIDFHHSLLTWMSSLSQEKSIFIYVDETLKSYLIVLSSAEGISSLQPYFTGKTCHMLYLAFCCLSSTYL